MKNRIGLPRAGAVVGALAALVLLPSRVVAQAFTLPQGVGAVTLAYQYVDNTGHRLSDGFLRRAGQSVTQSAVFEADYGITDRLDASFSVPYVWAKYTGALPPPSGLPVDACKCWHSGWQDFAFTARYRLGTENLALTPRATYVVPTHDYRFRGEAVLGRDLQEFQLGASVGARLPGVLSKGSVGATYTYSFVEKPVNVDIDRSNVVFDLGYAATRRLYVRASASYENTPHGLRIGSVTGRPFPLIGDYRGRPDLFAQRDRIGRVKYLQVGGGLSYDVGPADVFASVSSYVWGRDAHDGEVYTVGMTWYFDFRK